MGAGVERRKKLVTITARGRRPPRLGGPVSWSVESMKSLFKEYNGYEDELLHGACCVQGEEGKQPAMDSDAMSTSQIVSTERRFFRRGCGLKEEHNPEGAEKIVGVCRPLKQVAVMILKQGVA